MLYVAHIKKCLRKKLEVYAIDIHGISYEYEPCSKEPMCVEGFLAYHHNVFSRGLPKMPSQIEVDQAIKFVPSVTPYLGQPVDILKMTMLN